MSIPNDVSTVYNRFLVLPPLVTQALTMSLFCGLGDLFAQTQAFRTEAPSMRSYDWRRTRRFLLKGIGCGIIWSRWFLIAEDWSEFLTLWFVGTTKMSPDSSNIHTVVKTIASILLEQFIACPLIFGLWDLPILSIMHGSPPSSIPGIVRQKLLKLLIANAKLWTVVNVVIYNIPLKFRVLVLSIADIFWESLVSSIARQQEVILSPQEGDHIALIAISDDDDDDESQKLQKAH
jgi:Mpv17 / PMP22 family